MRQDSIPPWKQELLSRRSALAKTIDPDLDTKTALFQSSWKDGATTSKDESSSVFKRPLLSKLGTNNRFKTITCGVEGTNNGQQSAHFSPLTPQPAAGDPGRRCLSWPKDHSNKSEADVAVPSGSSPKLNGSLTKRGKTHERDPSSVIWNKAGLNKKMGEEQVIIGSDVDSDSSEDLHYGPGKSYSVEI